MASFWPKIYPDNNTNCAAGCSCSLHDSFPFLFKFTIQGSQGVGKTSFWQEYTEDYTEDMMVSIQAKSLRLRNGDRVKLQLWDTSENSKMIPNKPNFSRGSYGVIIIYDPYNRKTFEDIDQHYQDVPARAIKLLLANWRCNPSSFKKRDGINQEDIVSDAEGLRKAEHDGHLFASIDITQKHQIENAMNLLIDKCVEHNYKPNYYIASSFTKHVTNLWISSQSTLELY
eukprot:gb/GECH01001466.1/.p1 GENE.gb/GECH01001466.1/~~gb/GECH01001466.1/.p1  ORF type:complete len:228 (+),score=58.38 gb/GECH01001466.1/:1-684(+)